MKGVGEGLLFDDAGRKRKVRHPKTRAGKESEEMTAFSYFREQGSPEGK